MDIKTWISELENKIVGVYTEGVTLEDAEKLAAEFLRAQFVLSSELKKHDLSARMRKSGNKSIRAAVYQEAVSKNEKKPTEAQLSAMVEMNELVTSEQNALDKAEVERDELERLYSIAREAHVYFRGVAKGRFD